VTCDPHDSQMRRLSAYNFADGIGLINSTAFRVSLTLRDVVRVLGLDDELQTIDEPGIGLRDPRNSLRPRLVTHGSCQSFLSTGNASLSLDTRELARGSTVTLSTSFESDPRKRHSPAPISSSVNPKEMSRTMPLSQRTHFGRRADPATRVAFISPRSCGSGIRIDLDGHD
jgi:hypothetical protein